MKATVHIVLIFAAVVLTAADEIPNAVNALGIDLLQKQAELLEENGNLLLSPYSIQSALAMAYLGAEGDTGVQMKKVLRYPVKEEVFTAEWAEVNRQLSKMQSGVNLADKENPPVFNVANQLFVQKDFSINEGYLEKLELFTNSNLSLLDFKNEPDQSADFINQWVFRFTNGKIGNIVAAENFGERTRAVLANAVHFKASWMFGFEENNTTPKLFWINGEIQQDIPTMTQTENFGYKKFSRCEVVSIPYDGGKVQFLVILPRKKNGIQALRNELTAEFLESLRHLPSRRKVELHIPKFKIEPVALDLKTLLISLGMRHAFDVPQRSADFSGIAHPMPDDYLIISDMFHKAFVEVNEEGTEAAAASAIITLSAFGIGGSEPKPVVVRAEHPFIFAIQHVDTGICLFLGQLTDPKQTI